jgi:PhnB protein
MSENNTTTITPFLTVSNGKKAVDFYTAAFGAIEIKRFAKPEEKIYATLQMEGATFYIGDEEPELGNISPAINSHSPVRIILQTANADALFEKAIKAGATIICPMETEEDWRMGKLKDPFGHIWEIGYTL